MSGAPGEIRTPDPQVRSLVLYPAELRAQKTEAELCGTRPAPSILERVNSEAGPKLAETEGDAASDQRPQFCKPLMPLADLAKVTK